MRQQPVSYDPVTDYPYPWVSCRDGKEVFGTRSTDSKNCERMRRYLAASPTHRGAIKAYNELEAAMFAAFFSDEENTRISYSYLFTPSVTPHEENHL